MPFLKLSEPMIIDASLPLAVRVAGLRPGDGVEVTYGPPGDTHTWHPRSGPLPWIRATATTGEFMLDASRIDNRATFVAAMVGHRAVGVTASQMGGNQTWSHPGATARENERWAFLTFTNVGPGRVTLTARDEPAVDGDQQVPPPMGIESLSAVVDISASMVTAVMDGRLTAALAAIQAAASAIKISAVTVTFVGGDQSTRVVLPVKSAALEAVTKVVTETGWRTGTASDLTNALGGIGEDGDAGWIITDAAPPQFDSFGSRRLGALVVGTANSGTPDERSLVRLVAGESTAELAGRLMKAVS